TRKDRVVLRPATVGKFSRRRGAIIGRTQTRAAARGERQDGSATTVSSPSRRAAASGDLPRSDTGAQCKELNAKRRAEGGARKAETSNIQQRTSNIQCPDARRKGQGRKSGG